MELSMWIIEDWLKKYNPLSDIKTGARNIKNVRLLSEDRDYSGMTVYLNSHTDNKVICSSGQDYMILNSNNPNEIFNEILDAFEFYNDWDSRMTDLVYNGCSLQELLKEGHKLIQNYLVVADSTFLIREGYGDLDDMQKNQSYFEAFQRKLLPVEVLTKFDEDPKLRQPGIPPYLLEIPSMHKIDIVSNIIVRNVHMGWLICMRSDNTYEQVTMDLLGAFTRHINQWYLVHSQEQRFMDQSGTFLKILEDSYTDPLRIIHRLEAVNWYENDDKIVYVIRAGENSVSTNTVVKRHSTKIFAGSFAVEYNGDVVLIVNQKLCTPDSESLLLALLSTSGYSAGKGTHFKNILDLKKHYETAKIAVEQGSSPGQIHEFWDAVLPYMTELLQHNAPASLVHPGLSILRKYDLDHKTNLYRTLESFLQNNCSHTATAAALYIHRSTLLYRLDKILALTGLDLEQYALRLHLQISYLLDTD